MMRISITMIMNGQWSSWWGKSSRMIIRGVLANFLHRCNTFSEANGYAFEYSSKSQWSNWFVIFIYLFFWIVLHFLCEYKQIIFLRLAEADKAAGHGTNFVLVLLMNGKNTIVIFDACVLFSFQRRASQRRLQNLAHSFFLWEPRFSSPGWAFLKM